MGLKKGTTSCDYWVLDMLCTLILLCSLTWQEPYTKQPLLFSFVLLLAVPLGVRACNSVLLLWGRSSKAFVTCVRVCISVKVLWLSAPKRTKSITIYDTGQMTCGLLLFFALFFGLFLWGFFLVGVFFYCQKWKSSHNLQYRIYHPILEKTPRNIKRHLKKATLFRNTGRT